MDFQHKNFFFVILIVSFCTFQTTQLVSGQLGYIFHIHVANQLPVGSNPLLVHCQSKDNDIGYHTLNVNDEFQWHFTQSLRTLFFCHFWWDNKQAIFDVFNSSFGIGSCHNEFPGQGPQTCYWEARADGFYMASGNKFIKMNIWQI
ncbi:hypothetical protein M9H77_09482 [Catharanthus roseus]|uniref:Uncharacterized protein n=1 Tax=Catharanthus roseus TaxID=4058 RepID=A0ACC0C0Q1_CATRO|nr:hypothetical protein M9H77_09482 [Catharanthus roseus]